jgi:DeoR/GlpR family transcriptional regulator of sugar metabolism
MLVPERYQAIMNLLHEKQVITVTELSQTLFVSETSIRRDLTRLEKLGYLRKTYGGAMLIHGENDVISLTARMETEKEAKNTIASKAVSLVKSGSVIFLDSSSTALAMIPYLAKLDRLTVMTNGARIAVALAEHPHIKVYSTGGLLMHSIYSFHGAIAQRVLSGMHATLSFVSVKAIDFDKGAFCADEEEAHVRHIMQQNSNQKVLLCNSKKFGRQSSFYLCGLEDVDYIVTDQLPNDIWLSRFANASVQCL